MVDEDDVGALCLRFQADLVRLAAAHEVARIGSLPASGDRGHRHCASGDRQLGELVEVFCVDRGTEAHANEHRPFATARTFKHQAAVLSASSSSAPGTRTLRAGTTVEIACL